LTVAAGVVAEEEDATGRINQTPTINHLLHLLLSLNDAVRETQERDAKTSIDH
jgi:hypothetical protein